MNLTRHDKSELGRARSSLRDAIDQIDLIFSDDIIIPDSELRAIFARSRVAYADTKLRRFVQRREGP